MIEIDYFPNFLSMQNLDKFCGRLQDMLSATNVNNLVLVVHDWNAKVGKMENMAIGITE